MNGKVVTLARVRMRAKKNSFQEKMKASKPTASMAGRARGTATCQNARQRVAPLTRANSSMARGMSSKKLFRTQAMKGMLNTVYCRVKAV